MAFYRCDRGLGFDTSNSTGNSSDVLYPIKYNEYSTGQIRNIILTTLQSNFAFESTFCYNCYNKNDFNFKLDCNETDIRKDVSIYDIVGSRKFVPRVNFKEFRSSKYSEIFNGINDTCDIISDIYEDSIFIFIALNTTIILVITDMNLNIISREKFDISNLFINLISENYKNEIDNIWSEIKKYIKNPISYAFNDCDDAEVPTLIESLFKIKKSDCSYFKYLPIIDKFDIDLNDKFSDSFIHSDLVDMRIGTGQNEIIDNLIFIDDKIIFKGFIYVILRTEDDIPIKLEYKFKNADQTYLNTSIKYSRRSSSIISYTYILDVLYEYDIISKKITIKKHNRLNPNTDSINDIYAMEPYITQYQTLRSYDPNRFSKYVNSTGKYIQSSQLYYFYSPDKCQLIQYDIASCSIISTTKDDKVSNPTYDSFYYDTKSNIIYIVDTYYDSSIQVSRFTNNLDKISSFSVSMNGIELDSPFLKINDPNLTNTAYRKIYLRNASTNNTAKSYGIFVENDIINFFVTIDRVCQNPIKIVGNSCHIANLRISCDTGNLIDIQSPNTQQFNSNFKNVQCLKTLNTEIMSTNDIIDHIFRVSVYRISNEYVGRLHYRLGKMSDTYKLNIDYIFTGVYNTICHIIIRNNGLYFTLLIKNQYSNLTDYENINSYNVIINPSTLYLLNDYDTNYNGYNIDSSNSNYTDYYFN